MSAHDSSVQSAQRRAKLAQMRAEGDPYPESNPCPEPAMLRRVRIVIGVGMLMVFTMRGDPEEWSAFKSQRGADGQEIFDGFGSLVRPMRQQPVVRHSDAQRQRNVIRDEENGEPGPGELK